MYFILIRLNCNCIYEHNFVDSIIADINLHTLRITNKFIQDDYSTKDRVKYIVCIYCDIIAWCDHFWNQRR